MSAGRAPRAPGREEAAALRAVEVLDHLEAAHPDAKCALDFGSPLELLVATILAAQAQDKHINTLTPALFRRYPTAAAWASAPPEQVREDLRPTGFFNQKAKAVQATCQALVERHGGAVPEDLDALVALPGVGRKTANVVLGNAFGHPDRVAVDTHVQRLAKLLGFTRHDDPVKIEADLAALWPAARRTRGCHLLQFHGRRVCVARRPRCDACPVAPLCPSAHSPPPGKKAAGKKAAGKKAPSRKSAG